MGIIEIAYLPTVPFLSELSGVFFFFFRTVKSEHSDFGPRPKKKKVSGKISIMCVSVLCTN